MTTAFTEGQVQALRSVIGLWGETTVVLVGASALGCFLEFRWRKTHDLDLSVLVSLEDYAAGLATLPGWQPDSRLEHRWHATGNVVVDFIPIGGAVPGDTEIVWPRTGSRMSLAGLQLAFDKAEQFELTSDDRIGVAPPAVIAILKTVAYLDRPHERERDLEDLTHLLDEYLPENDDRRFSDDVVDLQLDYEDVSAFRLGRDIANMAGAPELRAVSGFVARVLDERDSAATLARMTRVGPRSWREDPEVLVKRLAAFGRGLADRS